MDPEEKIFRIYELACQHLFNDDRLLSERTNLFLLSSSILFVGFAALIALPNFMILKIAIPVIGMLFCFLQGFNARYTSRALEYWHREVVRRIEKDEGWEAVLKENLFGNITTNEEVFRRIKEQKQKGLALRTGFDLYFKRLGRVERNLLRSRRRGVPPKAWTVYLPGLFCVLWAISFI
ncbi:MAG: hypothetical protein MUP49_05205, partial [Dehalococcoidia bacterium]|nr:hypothetical protein [Dehalococcoidia bacterium]